MNFLERNGFISPDKIIIRNEFPKSIENAVVDALYDSGIYGSIGINYQYFDRYVWREIHHKALRDYSKKQLIYGEKYFIELIKDPNNEWYNKLFILEEFVKWLSVNNHNRELYLFKKILNSDFEKRNYAYRFIENNIEEITSEQEIKAIEDALQTNHSGVRTHLQTALQLLSAAQQEPDYRNSIKESISAVEAFCRTITGKSKFSDALDELKNKNISIHKVLTIGLKSIYGYTCDKDTGIRHALIEDGYKTTQEDAVYMLVMCSAFINYITQKMAKTNL